MNTTLWIVYIAIYVLAVAGMWMAFVKAGEEGWKAIIPIYNTLVLLKLIGREWWWVLLLLIPIVNLVVWIIICLDTAKSYGRGTGFGLGLALLPLIWWPILGFGSDTYRGPRGGPVAATV
jgi:Family of unknown function (DUF5684)